MTFMTSIYSYIGWVLLTSTPLVEKVYALKALLEQELKSFLISLQNILYVRQVVFCCINNCYVLTAPTFPSSILLPRTGENIIFMHAPPVLNNMMVSRNKHVLFIVWGINSIYFRMPFYLRNITTYNLGIQ